MNTHETHIESCSGIIVKYPLGLLGTRGNLSVQGPGFSMYDEKAKRGRYAPSRASQHSVDLGGKHLCDFIILFLRVQYKLQVFGKLFCYCGQ